MCAKVDDDDDDDDAAGSKGQPWHWFGCNLVEHRRRLKPEGSTAERPNKMSAQAIRACATRRSWDLALWVLNELCLTLSDQWSKLLV